MSKVRKQGEDIRHYILQKVGDHPNDITLITAQKFAISRQAVNKHLARLISSGFLIKTGRTRNQTYKLVPQVEWTKQYSNLTSLAEDHIWREDVRPALNNLSDNVLDIWHYGFTEPTRHQELRLPWNSITTLHAEQKTCLINTPLGKTMALIKR